MNDQLLMHSTIAMRRGSALLSWGNISPEELSSAARPTKLRDIERAFIVQTPEEVGWVVGGPDGAAAKLGLNRTTLIYRMKTLEIERPARSAVRLTFPLTNPN
jgi:transcriptional regulator with GAF, ATPase, and Fis domain